LITQPTAWNPAIVTKKVITVTGADAPTFSSRSVSPLPRLRVAGRYPTTSTGIVIAIKASPDDHFTTTQGGHYGCTKKIH
jgi:hypothetical protein